MRFKVLFFLIYFFFISAILFAQNTESFESLQLKPNKEFPSWKKQSLSEPTGGDISSLREEVEILRKQLRALEQYVERKEEKIDTLTNQLIEVSLKLSEKERLLEENSAQLTALSGQLTDIQARFELGERIIEEKERKIQSLAMSNPALEETPKDLQPSLKIYQEKLKEANSLIQEKVTQLNALNNDLAFWRVKFRKQEVLFVSRNKETQALKRTIDDLRWRALDADNHFKNYLSSKTKELYELRGILKIYKEKLKQVNNLIRDKVSALNESLN